MPRNASSPAIALFMNALAPCALPCSTAQNTAASAALVRAVAATARNATLLAVPLFILSDISGTPLSQLSGTLSVSSIAAFSLPRVRIAWRLLAWLAALPIGVIVGGAVGGCTAALLLAFALHRRRRRAAAKRRVAAEEALLSESMGEAEERAATVAAAAGDAAAGVGNVGRPRGGSGSNSPVAFSAGAAAVKPASSARGTQRGFIPSTHNSPGSPSSRSSAGGGNFSPLATAARQMKGWEEEEDGEEGKEGEEGWRREGDSPGAAAPLFIGMGGAAPSRRPLIVGRLPLPRGPPPPLRQPQHRPPPFIPAPPRPTEHHQLHQQLNQPSPSRASPKEEEDPDDVLPSGTLASAEKGYDSAFSDNKEGGYGRGGATVAQQRETPILPRSDGRLVNHARAVAAKSTARAVLGGAGALRAPLPVGGSRSSLGRAGARNLAPLGPSRQQGGGSGRA